MKIESDVPVPEFTEAGPKGYINTIRAMTPGDSVFIDNVERVIDCKFYNNAKVYATHNEGVKFRARLENNGVRVWRIS